MGMDCKYCGAYISSDVDKCPACGKRVGKNTDSARRYGAGSAAASASAQARAPESEQKAYTYKDEYSRRYGSEEYEVYEREEAGPEYRAPAQGEYRAREDYKSRAREYGAKAEAFVKRTASDESSKYRLVSYLSYFGILFLVPFLLYKDVEFCRFHANQGLLLLLLHVILNILGGVLSAVGWVFFIICFIRGIRSVHRGTMEPLPFIGGIKLL